MTKAEMLTPENRRKMLNRWKSIRQHARTNMAYGNGGSYATSRTDANGEPFISPTLERDRAALDIIDGILTDALKGKAAPAEKLTDLYLDRMDGKPVERRKIQITEAEYRAHRAVPREVDFTTVVYDRIGKEYLAITRDACGGGCRCAAQGFTLE